LRTVSKAAKPSKPALSTLISSWPRPKKVVITAGMPYANGPLHLGHLAGAQVPADIFARWMRMLVGPQNVLFVCGTDDHGSATELSAIRAGITVREQIDGVHRLQSRTMDRYHISLDVYSGTSQPDCFVRQRELVARFIRRLHANDMLEKRTTKQWYDPRLQRFLQDRFVSGLCPSCGHDGAYSDACENCGAQYQPDQLIEPKSTLSDAVPEQRETVHWWLDLWKVADQLADWIRTKKDTWRKAVYSEVYNTVLPTLSFANTHEARYKTIKADLPAHQSRYAPGKRVALAFARKADLDGARTRLQAEGIPAEILDGWAHRSITRDVSWGIPLPEDLDPDMRGKTLYVWPDSLIAPIAFSQVALAKRGDDDEAWRAYWQDPEARVFQFLGEDNVYFYVLMQGALWLGSQPDPLRLPVAGEYQFTEVLGCHHLLVDGQKMSKSFGNFYTGDQLLDERGYSADQVRYFLSTLGLVDRKSDFRLAALDERNRFLAGPMNAAFEKPISACHSKFGGVVPDGVLDAKVEERTYQIVAAYLRSMSKASYLVLLGEIENYARLINGMFAQFKPHDDRRPEKERADALYSSFFVLKNLMIMLYPFVPDTMERLRISLALPADVFRVEALGTGIAPGHHIGAQVEYFPPANQPAP
jgi:methionyl-tRNA synthetase